MNIYKKMYMLIIACFVFPIFGMEPIIYRDMQDAENKIKRGTFHNVSESILRLYHNDLTDSVLRIVDYAYANFPKDKTIPHMSVARIIISDQHDRKVYCDLPYIFLSRETVKNFSLPYSKIIGIQISMETFDAIQSRVFYALDSGGAKSQSPAAQSHSERSMISCLANDKTFSLIKIIEKAGVQKGDIRSILIESRNFLKPCNNCIAFLQTRSRVKYDTQIQRYVYMSIPNSFPVQNKTYTAEQTIYEWISSKSTRPQRIEILVSFFFETKQNCQQDVIDSCTFGPFNIFI